MSFVWQIDNRQTIRDGIYIMSPNEATLVIPEEKKSTVYSKQTRKADTTPSTVMVNDVFLSPSKGEKIT